MTVLFHEVRTLAVVHVDQPSLQDADGYQIFHAVVGSLT